MSRITLLLPLALLTLTQVARADNRPENAQRAVERDVVPKVALQCGVSLSISYDAASLRESNQDIRDDQTDGSSECNEALRYLWYACQTNAGKATVTKSGIAKLVCKGTASSNGSLTRKGDALVVERAYQEADYFKRARSQFEALLKMPITFGPQGSESPYRDQAWRDLEQSANPVTSTTDYCLVNGDKQELSTRWEDSFVRRKQDAQVKCWKGGELVTDIQVKQGARTGFVTELQPDRLRRVSYRDGKQHGELTVIEKGKLHSLSLFSVGEQVWLKEFFPSGKLKSYTRKFPEGSAQWEQKEDGKVYRLYCLPAARGDEVLREPCGFGAARTTSIYDGTGKVGRIETWKDGVLQRLAAGDSAHAQRDEVSFVDGKKQGEERHYAEDGKLASITSWNKGVQEGKEAVYADDGKKVVKETLWSAGKPTRITELYLNGNPRSVEQFESETKKRTTSYWDTGKLKKEGTFILRETARFGGSYRGWVEEGVHRAYYESGALRSEETWRDGKQDGPGKELWENGTPAALEEFAQGVRTKSKRWDESGKLLADEELEADGSRKLK
jgi:antitoxin component YwqK of YwqJK toxin-antitoxin module